MIGQHCNVSKSVTTMIQQFIDGSKRVSSQCLTAKHSKIATLRFSNSRQNSNMVLSEHCLILELLR